jgi:hypothetical protein
MGTAGPLAISSFDMLRFVDLRPFRGYGLSPKGALELVLDLGWPAEMPPCVTEELVLTDNGVA